MPASFTVDVPGRMVLSRAWGILVDADLRESQRGLRDTPGFAPDFRQLFDFSDVTDIHVTVEGLWDIARQSPFMKDARRAIVVASDVAFGMVRMYQLVGDRERPQFQIFRDRALALHWLESPPAA